MLWSWGTRVFFFFSYTGWGKGNNLKDLLGLPDFEQLRFIGSIVHIRVLGPCGQGKEARILLGSQGRGKWNQYFVRPLAEQNETGIILGREVLVEMNPIFLKLQGKPCFGNYGAEGNVHNIAFGSWGWGKRHSSLLGCEVYFAGDTRPREVYAIFCEATGLSETKQELF